MTGRTLRDFPRIENLRMRWIRMIDECEGVESTLATVDQVFCKTGNLDIDRWEPSGLFTQLLDLVGSAGTDLTGSRIVLQECQHYPTLIEGQVETSFLLQPQRRLQ